LEFSVILLESRDFLGEESSQKNKEKDESF
jgi:hypothetical protein